MRTVLSTLAAIFACQIMIGCSSGLSSYYEVSVDSITDPGVQAKSTYVLLPGNSGITIYDLNFREYADYVRKALTKQGLTDAPLADAKLAIFLIYGIGDPKLTPYSYSIPIFGQTSGGTTSVNLSTYGSDGISNTSGTITTKPTYGIVGSTTYSGVNVSYFRFFILDAVDLDKFRNDSMSVVVWRTTVTSSGSSGDLRRVFPVMVGASTEYLGTNTLRQVSIQLQEDDLRVKAIRPKAVRQSK